MYVYRFLNKENEVIYIGKSKDIINRLINHNHLSKECYQEVELIEFQKLKNKTEMDIYENYYINKISPKYNIKDKRSDDVSGLNLVELDFKHKVKKDILKYSLNLHKRGYNFSNEIDGLDFIENFDFKVYVSEYKDNSILLPKNLNEEFLKYISNDFLHENDKYEKLKEQIVNSPFIYEISEENSPFYLYNIQMTGHKNRELELKKAQEFIYEIDLQSKSCNYYYYRWFYDYSKLYEIGLMFDNIVFNINTYDYFIYLYNNELVFIKNNFDDYIKSK